MTNSYHVKRSEAPQLHLIEDVNFIVPEEITLNNGIPVYLQKGGSQDIVRLEFVFKSGSYQQQKPLQAFAMTHLLKSGTQNKSAAQINELWDFYGAALQIDAQKDIITAGFVSLTRYLPQALALLLEMISQPVFPQEELDIFIANRKQKHLVNQQKVQYLARVHFSSLIFGDQHPYGRILSLEDFGNINRQDLETFYRQHIHPGNCIAFVSGNYPDDMGAILNNALKNTPWQALPNGLHSEIPLQPDMRRQHHVEKEDAVQSALRIGKTVISRKHPDHHKLMIANALLGGYFGSRLMQNVRQDKGYTYGINSAIVNLMQAAYFFVSSQVGNDVASKAVDEVYLELRRLFEQPASEAELNMLKNYLSASFLRSFDGPFLQAERFKEILLFDQDYSYFSDYLATLKSISPQEIQEVAFNYLHPDQMTELVVG